MTDVAVTFDGTRFDLSYGMGDLLSDDGLETAVAISLFTDRRVLPEEIDRDSSDRRGWWGDALNEGQDLIGSRLWLLDRAKVSEETRALSEEYCKEALEWMTDDGVAESVDVRAFIIKAADRIDLEISITRPKVKNVNFYRFQLVWDGQLMKARKVES